MSKSLFTLCFFYRSLPSLGIPTPTRTDLREIIKSISDSTVPAKELGEEHVSLFFKSIQCCITVDILFLEHYKGDHHFLFPLSQFICVAQFVSFMLSDSGPISFTIEKLNFN